jgi:hypothetical protein
MGTEGLCSASSPDDGEVLIFETQTDEWNDIAVGICTKIESRIADEIGKSDFWLIPYPTLQYYRQIQPKSASFREFRKTYKSPTLSFACPFCTDGEAQSVQVMPPGKFMSAGGTIITLNGLAL